MDYISTFTDTESSNVVSDVYDAISRSSYVSLHLCKI